MLVAALVAAVAAVPSPVAAQGAGGLGVELGVGAGMSKPSAPTPGASLATGPTVSLAVHGHYRPRVLLGVDVVGWQASDSGQQSRAGFALLSTRLFFLRPDGLTMMAGLGLAHATYASFQHDPRYNGTVNRLAIGGGLGYEIPSSGALRLGAFYRYFNTLGGRTNAPGHDISSGPPVDPAHYHGGSILSQAGVSLRWR